MIVNAESETRRCLVIRRAIAYVELLHSAAVQSSDGKDDLAYETWARADLALILLKDAVTALQPGDTEV